MAGKHTAGPWSVLVPHADWHGRPVDDWAITVDGHNTWICTGPTWDAEYQAESAANARLIAAAPDLLEACQRALEQTDPVARSGDYAMLRAAITRATQPLPPQSEEQS